MRGRGEPGRTTSAIYYAADDFNNDRVREISNRLGGRSRCPPRRLLALTHPEGREALRIHCAIYRHWRRTTHPLIPLAPGACPGVDIPFRCSMKSAAKTADAGPPMSEIDRDLIPSREEERLLKRVLGCAIPEFIARLGADGAVKRVEVELRRARRARSRKLYAFWSAVLAQIDPGRNEISIRGERTAPSPFGPRRGRQFHEGPARLSDDPLSPATAAGAAPPGIAGQVLETPAPNAPRRAASRA